jgi:hypothetical protein
MLMELLRREKDAGIKPDGDLDIFMKVHYLILQYFLCSFFSVNDGLIINLLEFFSSFFFFRH